MSLFNAIPSFIAVFEFNVVYIIKYKRSIVNIYKVAETMRCSCLSVSLSLSLCVTVCLCVFVIRISKNY